MKKGFFLSVLAFAFLGLSLCSSARAQTWKELLDQADSLYKAAAYDSATVVGELALERAEKEFGENDTTVASALNLVGEYYSYQAKYDEAESLLKRALAIREKAVGYEHPTVAQSLSSLATLYWRQGRYAEAEPLHKQALAIRKKALEAHHPDVAKSLTGLAILSYIHGRYAEAESLYKQALAIRKKALRPDHPDVAKSLNNLAVLYYKQGRYTEAERLYKQALAIFGKTVGLDHPRVTKSLNNLAHLSYIHGRYAEAESLYKRALAIRKKTLSPGHPHVANSLNNLASLCHKQGKYAEAESLLMQAMVIWREALGPDHPDVATSLNNLGILYHKQGKYTEAEPLHKQALAIWKKALGPDHPEVAKDLANLAILYHDQDKCAEAESLYKRAISIYEKTFGPDYPYTVYVLHHMALLFKKKKDFTNARKTGRRASTICRQSFRDGFEVLSEKDALTYSEFMRDEANQYISILLDSQDTSSSCRNEVAEVVFSTKGQVSDGIFARYIIQVYEKDPNLKPLSDSLEYARFRMSNLYVRGPGEDVEVYKSELDSLTREKERLEAELARRSADFRREQELWEVDAEKVANGLPANSVLVEYMKFDRLTTGRDTEPHYLLLVVDSKEEVFVSDLGSSDEIDSLITLYRLHFQDISGRGGSALSADMESYKDIASKLYERIWRPVEQELSGANLLFIAPDGALNLVSFAGLIDAEGKYLIESYPIQYLSSGRDLVRLKHILEPGEGLFALGDPDFDASASARLSSEAALARAPESDSLFFYRLRNIRSGCEALHEITVLPLPGTRKEVERISEVWEKKSQEPCHAFFGPDASEDNFKRSAPGSKVIHLATHGYYAESDCRPDLPKSRFGMREGFVGENPLLLSGLFLAGANLHGEGADSLGLEDGILTAEEVTGMDLEGTKWVILSACESGLGEVKAGEGVYGLRRAFQMAGARTVISALWPVSDKATADMMSYLYGFEEDNLALAMQSLAKTKLEELRKRHQPDHPYLWAPFIAMGDWR